MYRVIRKRRVKRHPIVKAARLLVLASPVLAAIVYAWYPKYPDYAREERTPTSESRPAEAAAAPADGAATLNLTEQGTIAAAH